MTWWTPTRQSALAGFLFGCLLTLSGMLALDVFQVRIEALRDRSQAITRRRPPLPSGEARLTTDALTSRIAPRLQALAEANKEQIVQQSGGPLVRLAVRAEWSRGMKAIPGVVQGGVNYVRDELGHWSVRDLLEWLETEAAKRPEQPPSPLLNDLRTRFATQR